MKRLFLTIALLSSCALMTASPVSSEEALRLGGRFVSSHFRPDRQQTTLTLVKTTSSYYVINVGNTGFLILSADDSYRPLIAYSQEGTFDLNDVPPAFQEFLDNIEAYRGSRGAVNADVEAADDWKSLRATGKLKSRHGGREDEYLVQTKWNQNYPYNYLCPADDGGSGGHVYAGCVATAASQLMKYWNHPVQGQGSHSYTPSDNPQYGTQYANFGETTYDWDNMPISISSASPMVEIEAVALLHYHVGVSVDMNYRPTGSGAATNDLKTVMPLYFNYCNAIQIIKRDDCTKEEYLQLMINSFDMAWPVVHAGGGHAYIFDGYDDYNMLHVNWGWGGSSDSFIDIDAHGYTDGQRGLFNYVPDQVYRATPNAPTNLAAAAVDDHSLAANVSWTNPSTSLTNAPLTALDQVVVMRDNEVVYTVDGAEPGADMSFVDTTIPRYDTYQYTVYTVVGGQRGKSVVLGGVTVGPTCPWKFVITSTNFMGWRGAYISIINGAETEVTRVTLENSNPNAVYVDMPLGVVKFGWVPSSSTVNDFDITITVKDAENNTVYSYSGLMNAMEEGVFFEANNGCGNSPDCGTPTNLTAVQDPEDEHTIVLSWTGVENPGYGYVIYRDSLMYRLVSDGSTEFRDENVPLGGHCYWVTTLCDGGWNGETSNPACESSGPYFAPRNFNFETTANFKCKLLWEEPISVENLTGYYLYRKSSTQDYKRIKLLNPGITTYTDNAVSAEDTYCYKLVAYYREDECFSAPAAYIYNPYQYYVQFYYSPTAVDEDAHSSVKLYPNPTSDGFTIEASDIHSVEVCNVLGQTVMVHRGLAGMPSVSLSMEGYASGVYTVRVQSENGWTTHRLVKQ